MCRFGFANYKSHYACFACRKSFKRRHKAEVDPTGEAHPARCPQCRLVMADMGLDFAPPKMRDAKAWAAAETLVEAGITFHSCGCSGPGYRPRDPAKLAVFFDDRMRAYTEALRGWVRTETTPSGRTADERTRAIAAWRRRIKRLEAARDLLK